MTEPATNEFCDGDKEQPHNKFDNRIESVSIQGLHNQFDVSIKLNPGLNIIYGKNGKGKTTLLHILTNAIELDFRRFSGLRFSNIEIKTFSGNRLNIIKEGDLATPVVLINGDRTSMTHDNYVLSDAEAKRARQILGGRPTYLPAFRSILERTRAETQYAYRAESDPSYRELQELQEQEYKAIRESLDRDDILSNLETRTIKDEALNTARKTIQCRQWFGSFTPTIRYPSILDVEENLIDEWRTAQFEVSKQERKLFEDGFLDVFKTVSGLSGPPEKIDKEELLRSIELLSKDNASEIESENRGTLFTELTQAIARLQIRQSPSADQGAENVILKLYVQMLNKRNAELKRAYQSSRDFSASVKQFFGDKTISIKSLPGYQRTRTAVRIDADNGHNYGLNSLSSGERQIITMLFSARRSRHVYGPLLIDEPELSLHIDWQRIILQQLKQLANGRQIIACTHSPEVGADHIAETQDFEPKQCGPSQNSLFDNAEGEE